MKILVMACVVLCTACGNVCENTQEVTDQGICVDVKQFQVDMDMVSAIVDLSLRRTSERFGYTVSELQSFFDVTSIHFIEHFGDSEIDAKAAGINNMDLNWNTPVLEDNKYKIQVKYYWIDILDKVSCRTWWILEHELLHEYLDITEGYPNGDYAPDSPQYHPKRWYMHEDYSVEDNKNSLEMKIALEIYQTYCPEVYEN